ncbi:MAG: cytochrome c-type biogenesis protein CcmH [Acidobacteria bacterium]|nr:cytochrome c-type biogenesis protein CcmH [Acidobacteriota bacterium]
MRRHRLATGLLLLLVLTPGLAARDTEELVSRITGNIICPCGTNCANLLVRNCDCSTAAEITQEVRKLVNEGKNEAEIYAYYEKKYGLHMMAAPKPEGFNLLAWLLPFAGLAFGACLIVLVVKKLKPVAPDSGSQQVHIDEKFRKLLDEELRE